MSICPECSSIFWGGSMQWLLLAKEGRQSRRVGMDAEYLSCSSFKLSHPSPTCTLLQSVLDAAFCSLACWLFKVPPVGGIARRAEAEERVPELMSLLTAITQPSRGSTKWSRQHKHLFRVGSFFGMRIWVACQLQLGQHLLKHLI